MQTIDIGRLIRQIPSQYPFVLVDRVLDHDDSGLRAIKGVTGSEEFFEGHFPGAPVMPGVLILESLAQAAGIWLLNEAGDPSLLEVHVVGIDGAKFRRQVLPGDRLSIDVRVLRRHGPLCKVRGEVRSGDARVAEATLFLRVVALPRPEVDPTARVAAGARLGAGVRVGPYCVVGPEVELGAGTVLESHVVLGGHTRVGRDNRFYPFATAGLAPQDLKFHGEASRLEIGDRNTFRECCTIHVGTEGGGGVTRIGSDNLVMAYAHVAHDCQVGDHVIFANHAALAGHVEVQDWATVGAYSGVHQFCRVGTHAFIGGGTIATQDVLPYSKTVGNRACLYGVNTVGLQRRGLSREAIAAVRQAFGLLMSSKLPTSEAVRKIEAECPATAEVATLLAFVRQSQRGVITRRRRAGGAEDEAED